MRVSNLQLTVKDYVDVMKNIAFEEFHMINENKILKHIEVTVAYIDSSNSVVKVKLFLIDGEKYNLLMSESPDFAIGKPANEYREDDLWYIIDRMVGD